MEAREMPQRLKARLLARLTAKTEVCEDRSLVLLSCALLILSGAPQAAMTLKQRPRGGDSIVVPFLIPMTT